MAVDPTPAAPDQAEGPRAPKAPRIPRFQVEKVRIHGERSDGSQYIRETYRVVANVGLGRKKANRIVGVLSQLRESQQVPNSQLTPNSSHIRSWDDPTMKMREIL